MLIGEESQGRCALRVALATQGSSDGEAGSVSTKEQHLL